MVQAEHDSRALHKQGTQTPPAPRGVSSESRAAPHSTYEAGARALQPSFGPPPPERGPSVQRSTAPPSRTQARAIQRKAPAVATKAGADTAFDTELTIPLWGPVSFKGKVLGSFTQNKVVQGKGDTNTEVEVAVFGGLHANLVFATLSVGVRGRIKVSVPPTSDPIAALKAGLAEVMRWEVARDFARKVADGRKQIAAAANTAKTALAEVIATAKKDKHLPDFALHSHVLGYSHALHSALKSIGAKPLDDKALLAKISAAAAPVFKLQELSDENRRDPATTLAKRLAAIDRLGASLATLIDGSRANVETLFGNASAPGNNPKVGFEAALSLEVGASVAATQSLGVEVQLIRGVGIEDKQGEGAWNHKVGQSKAIAASFTLNGFQLTLTGSMKDDDEVEVAVAVTRKKAAIEGKQDLTAQEAASFAKHAFQIARMKELFGASRTTAFKSAAQGLAGVLGKHLQAKPSAQFQGESSASVEIKAKGSIKQNKMLGGSVKVVPNQVQISGSGPMKGVGVSGSVRSGQFVEVAIEFG